MMRVETPRLSAPNADYKMTLKYMRAGGSPDDRLVELAKSAAEHMRRICDCRVCYTRLPICINGDITELCGQEIKSAYLSKHLADCREAFLFAATLGSASERFIRASASHSALNELAADAAGSALVEALCDSLNEMLSEKARLEGKTTLRRYSPGYGDFPLETQKLFSDILNTQKNIGAYLTDGLMMYPTKTVTAIIGIKNERDYT